MTSEGGADATSDGHETPGRAFDVAIRSLAFRDDVPFDDVLRKALATDARALAVERVSFWRLRRDPDALFCELLFVQSTGKFEHGHELEGASYPAYFTALKTGVVIAAHDARTDARTREFAEDYLAPLGIGAMLDTPVFVRGTLSAVVCHEHVGPPRSFTFEEQQFAFSVGQVLSLAFESRDRRSAEAALRESVQGLVAAKEAADVANRELRAAMSELEARDARLVEEEQNAQEFQQSILPILPQVAGLDITATYRPLDLVGGDIYDVALLGGDAGQGPRLQMFIADATGHGVAAALTTMFIRSEYEAIKRTAASPGVVLAMLNERLTRSYGHLGMRFTAACFAFDVTTGAVVYASAAHPNAYVVHDGVTRELDTGGTFVGLSPDATYDELTTTLTPGDGLYVFTDGVTEAFDSSRVSFGEGPLAAVLADAHGSRGDVGDRVWLELEAFVGVGREMHDDATMVGFRWSAPHP